TASPTPVGDRAHAPRGDGHTTRTTDAATTAAAATPTNTPIPLPPGATPIPPLITPITGTPTEADLRAQDVANRARLALEEARQMDLRKQLEREKKREESTATVTNGR